MPEELDDRLGPDQVTEKQPRTVSKTAFGCLSMCLCVAIILLLMVAGSAISRGLGVRFEGGWIAGLGFPVLILSRFLLDAILKRMGLSDGHAKWSSSGRPIHHDEADDPIFMAMRSMTICSYPAERITNRIPRPSAYDRASVINTFMSSGNSLAKACLVAHSPRTTATRTAPSSGVRYTTVRFLSSTRTSIRTQTLTLSIPR